MCIFKPNRKEPKTGSRGMASVAKMLRTILQLESLLAKYISKIGRNLHKFEKKKI
jgi:hypothetical protein